MAVLGDKIFKEVIKVKSQRWDPNPTGLVSLKEEEITRVNGTYTQKKGYLRAERESKWLQARKRGLTRNQLC